MVKSRTVTEAPPEEAFRLRMSYEEYLAWADEDKIIEWVDGEVIVHMPPKDRHQDVVIFLVSLLRFFADFFHLGKIRTAPFEMKLSPRGPAREPDILFVASDHLDRLTEDRVAGPADLVVEVLSDDSVTRDRVKKFHEYQAAGVREYWIVDSRPGKEQVDFWVADENGQFQSIPIGDDSIYRSTILPGFWLHVNWLWSETLPDPQLTFAEIAGFPPQLLEALHEIAARGPRAAEPKGGPNG